MHFSNLQHRGYKQREPIRFSEPPSHRNKNKWDKIIDTFMKGRIDELKQIYRNGSRGRIFEVLVKRSLDILGQSYTGVSEINHSESSNSFIDKRFRSCLL